MESMAMEYGTTQVLYATQLADLYDKDLVAFGTGGFAKRFIPLLTNNRRIYLHGMTNSRIADDEVKEFENTHLMIRSLRAWQRAIPNVTFYAALDPVVSNLKEIYEICNRAGVKALIVTTFSLLDELVNYSQDAHSLQMIYEMPSVPVDGNPMLRLSCMANELRDLHRAAFAEFRGCHKGETVAVVGAGPTLNNYEPIRGIKHIGVNVSFRKKDLTLDYYFIFHERSDWAEEIKKMNCVKFFGINTSIDSNDRFPVSYIEACHGRQFYSAQTCHVIYPNIEYYPLMNFRSIIFPAIHFAIHTRPERILLVGCDCAASKCYFTDNSQAPKVGSRDPFLEPYMEWLDGYRCLKRFMQAYYPDIEIVSVNPVGLKGMFHDVYTESYLDAHPEIDRTKCEILRPEDYQK